MLLSRLENIFEHLNALLLQTIHIVGQVKDTLMLISNLKNKRDTSVETII